MPWRPRVALIEELLGELDRRWRPTGEGKIRLCVIGSAALVLQTKYDRGTKDGDVLETQDITAEVKQKLLAIAGKGTDIHARFKIYLDVVAGGLPLLPPKPVFHPVAGLSRMRYFDVRALDVVDVVVSKLRRFSADDEGDVRAMSGLGLLGHKRLVKRFGEAIDHFQLDARAEELPGIIKNLNKVERDYLRAVPSKFDLPEWLG